MNSADLAAFIAKHDIPAELIYMEADTPTVETAAEALGVHPDQIVKSILCLADGTPVLVVASGTARLDLKRLADHLGLARKRVKMADAPTVLEISGFEVGAMPPFGHKTKLRTVIDGRVFAQPEVYGGGGDINAMMRIAPAEIVRVTGGEQVDVTQNHL
jgi:Cys-tRNA(Pro) deacylase